MNPKYPEIAVDLSQQDGNAFYIIGAVRKALRRAGLTANEIAKFTDEAKAGDYDHLLQTCIEWVELIDA